MKRTTRRRLVHWTLYALLAALIALAVWKLDKQKAHDNFWDDGRNENWELLITQGAVNTIKYTAIVFGLGLALALVIALMRMSPLGPYRWLAAIYTDVFRGIPMLIMILVMAFGVPILFNGWRPPGGTIGAGLIGMIIVASAYMAETLRAGIQAVPKGQTEAARSLGMGAISTTTRVVLPQAFRIVIPPLTNEFVLLIKDTSLLAFAGIMVDQRELTKIGQDLQTSTVSATAGTATSLVQVAIIYLAITIPLTQLVSWLERRQRRATR